MKNRFNLLSGREFITHPDGMVTEILKSKQDGNIIGIISPALGGPGMYLTAVDDFILADGDNPLVVLKRFDMNGYLFPINKIPLNSIKAVCPFISKFENPYLPKADPGLKDMLA